jgi:hypothetical protein
MKLFWTTSASVDSVMTKWGLLCASLVSLAACISGAAATAGAAKDGLYVCAEHADPDDWDAEFANGPIVVPAGTVFDYAGHVLAGNLQDPRDSAHFDVHDGWKGLSPEEAQRRSSLISRDMAVDQKNTSGVATLSEVVLTKSAPCAFAPAEVVLSKNWGWSISPIHGDESVYYQIYGVIRRGALDTNFDDDRIPLNSAASRGEINASVRGTITRTVNLDEWSTTQPPDDMPVEGQGNSECWGDATRQDISCRALTENFLMSMRGATKAEVAKAMNVAGRDIDHNRLHFLSNYSRGQRWGSGIVNFVFDKTGRVSIIFATVDSPTSESKHAEFIWNAELLPAGCSDLPATSMKHCN